MYLQKLIVTLLLLFVSVSVVGAQEVDIQNNGENATSSAELSENKISAITQTNIANIQNNISIYSNTGNNRAQRNDGNVTITTGNSNVAVSINNISNANIIDNHCCLTLTPTQALTYDPSITPTPDSASSTITASITPTPSVYVLSANTESGTGGLGVLGLSDTSSFIKNNIPFILGINLITLGFIFLFEFYIDAKNSPNN